MMSSRGGFALSLVLWIVAALLLGIALLVSFSKDTLHITQGVKEKLETRLKAQSTLQKLKYYLLTGSFDSISVTNNLKGFPKKIVLDGREHKVGNVTFSVTDLSAKINLFFKSPDMVAKFASNNQRELFYTMRDSLKDWLDLDNEVSLNGAERSYYRLKLDKNYIPRNAPAIQSVEELWLIRGFSTLAKKEQQNLQKYFYAQTLGSGINLALVPMEYLSKLLHLNTIEATVLDRLKQENLTKFIEILSKNKNFNDDYMGFYPSFKVEIKIRVNKKSATSELHTIINLKNSKAIKTYRFEML